MSEAEEMDCPECGGQGGKPVASPRCCGRSDWECGARGCTGPEPEWTLEQCEYCRGSGTVAVSDDEPPPFEPAILQSEQEK